MAYESLGLAQKPKKQQLAQGIGGGAVFPPRQPVKVPGGWKAPVEHAMGQEMMGAKSFQPVPMAGGYYGTSNPSLAQEGIGVPKPFTGPFHNPEPGRLGLAAPLPQPMAASPTPRGPYQSQIDPNTPPPYGHMGPPVGAPPMSSPNIDALNRQAKAAYGPGLGLAAPSAAVAPAFRDFRVAPEGTIQGPSYAQRLQSGDTPFSSPALGNRYAAATQLGLAGAISPFGSNVEGDIAKARGIAKQNNYRESMLADLNGVSRGMPKPPPEKNYRNMSDADRERIAARFPGGKFLPYGSEPNGAAGAMTKADADQIDATKLAGAQLGLAKSRRANGFEPSPGGMSPQEKYDMRQYDKRNATRQLTADRASGKAQTPRQVRMLRAAEAQKQQFEQGLGLASPNAYAAMKDSAGRMALAKSQQDSTNAFRESDLGLRRDALKQQATLAAEREKGATERTKLGLAGKGVDETGKPLDTKTAGEKIAAGDKLDLTGLSPDERKLAVADLPAPTQRRLLDEAEAKDIWWKSVEGTNPLRGILSGGKNPMMWPALLGGAFASGAKAPTHRPARRGKAIP